MRETERAGPQLGLQLHPLEVRGASDLPGPFTAATRGRAGALLVMDDVLISLLKVAILDQAAKHSRPVVANYKEFAEAGALITFAHNVEEEYRQAAYYVHRILRGAKPADLPIEQPRKFELIINMKTAKALGLVIPPSVLLRADQVIQ